jgi:hypothetical protein
MKHLKLFEEYGADIFNAEDLKYMLHKYLDEDIIGEITVMEVAAFIEEDEYMYCVNLPDDICGDFGDTTFHTDGNAKMLWHEEREPEGDSEIKAFVLEFKMPNNTNKFSYDNNTLRSELESKYDILTDFGSCSDDDAPGAPIVDEPTVQLFCVRRNDLVKLMHNYLGE